MKKIPEFLTLAEVIEIHQNQVELYGGENGIRDIHLLTSALAMPESTFDGNFLHTDLFEMAAAYDFHVCQNHPFIDSNKRVGLVAALVFLDFNGIEIEDPKEELYEIMMAYASGNKNKKNLARDLKRLSK